MPQVTNASSRSVQKSRHDVQGFGPGKKGVMLCTKCDAYYHKKSWHHDVVAFLAKRENRAYETRKMLCPACEMIKNKLYEGKLVVRGVPAEQVDQIVHLIENSGAQGYAKDPLERIIATKRKGKDIEVTTTENQLAHRIAKRIRDSFRKVKFTISYEKTPGDVTIAVLEFPQLETR